MDDMTLTDADLFDLPELLDDPPQPNRRGRDTESAHPIDLFAGQHIHVQHYDIRPEGADRDLSSSNWWVGAEPNNRVGDVLQLYVSRHDINRRAMLDELLRECVGSIHVGVSCRTPSDTYLFMLDMTGSVDDLMADSTDFLVRATDWIHEITGIWSTPVVVSSGASAHVYWIGPTKEVVETDHPSWVRWMANILHVGYTKSSSADLVWVARTLANGEGLIRWSAKRGILPEIVSRT